MVDFSLEKKFDVMHVFTQHQIENIVIIFKKNYRFNIVA